MSRNTDYIEWEGAETRRLITQLFNAFQADMENHMATIQSQLDALTDRVDSGVAELRTEIDRLAALPAAEQVDFSRLQQLADQLANDNVPAAPAEDPAPVDPETPADEPVQG